MKVRRRDVGGLGVRRLKRRTKRLLFEPEPLHVYLSPEPQVVSQDVPRLEGLDCVLSSRDMFLEAEVNGRYTTVCIDSGTDCSIMRYSEADRLGLLEMVAVTVPFNLFSFFGSGEVQVGLIPSLPMDLDGVRVCVEMTVCPDSHYPWGPRVLLGLNLLMNYHVIKAFSEVNTRLYFANPGCSDNPTLEFPQTPLLEAHLTKSRKDAALNVLVDSGSTTNYISEELCSKLSALQPSYTQQSGKMLTVKIHLSDNHSITTEFEKHDFPSGTIDFLLGSDLLAECQAMTDYSTGHVYLQHKSGKRYQTQLHLKVL